MAAKSGLTDPDAFARETTAWNNAQIQRQRAAILGGDLMVSSDPAVARRQRRELRILRHEQTASAMQALVW